METDHQLTISKILSYEENLVEKWDKENTYHINGISEKKKYYVLVMFPYPSGKVHMGHVRNYSLGDALARYKRLRGFHVLHPIGWDSFGLPAENAAIKNNIPPAEWTHSNIDAMRIQLKRMGFSYDWGREIATCTSRYYHWNQYIFLKFLEKGWAYKKEAWVNWCGKCSTVLANEQVVNGTCWRHENEKIQKKNLAQWFFKITGFADELLEAHASLNGKWPNRVLSMQKNWIGRSEGALVRFKVLGDSSLTVFTTRVDTIYGATYLALAPENPLLEKIRDETHRQQVEAFREKVLSMSEMERENPDHKEGIFTGLYAEHPLLDKKIPIYAANFVLPQYGTGAVMSVPAHDQRDFEFAKKYGLPIIQVIAPQKNEDSAEPISLKEAFTQDGFLINSNEHTNMTSQEAREKITQKLTSENSGEPKTEYRIRDWLISRQRYWGTPIPVVYCEACGVVPLNAEDLPVLLPEDVAFDQNKNPLTDHTDFLSTDCPKCGGEARRETDTMDTFVDSSWYFLRYVSPDENKSPVDKSMAEYFMPVDHCIGGIEHANMHLLYARYFMRALNRLDMVKGSEPFASLLTQGMVLKDGKAMSKSLGNVVEPDELIEKYGADTLRVFSLFAAPAEKDLDWSEFAVEGSFRMIKRLYRFVEEKRTSAGLRFTAHGPKTSLSQERSFRLMQETHAVIKMLTEEMERLSYNTSIARLMEMLNFYYLHYFDLNKDGFEPQEEDVLSFSISSFLTMLMPFAPFVSWELLSRMGMKKEEELSWPAFDEKYLIKNQMTIVIQINGKTRGQIEVGSSSKEEEILTLAKSEKKAAHHLAGKTIRRSIYVPKKLVNFVV